MNPITLTPPAFGTLIAAQGGILAAIMRGPTVDGIEQAPFALLVAAEISSEFERSWGEYGVDVPGAASRTDGLANTEAMLAAGCPAAMCLREQPIAGHSDWYLPSLGELNAAAANVPELFGTEGLYWTSTQGSRHSAFVRHFGNGSSNWDDKDIEWRVRPFRRIPLDLLNA